MPYIYRKDKSILKSVLLNWAMLFFGAAIAIQAYPLFAILIEMIFVGRSKNRGEIILPENMML